jgi:hypothetical protein
VEVIPSIGRMHGLPAGLFSGGRCGLDVALIVMIGLQRDWQHAASRD